MAEMETEAEIVYERGLTFEKVWAFMKEQAREWDRRSQEIDRRFQETDRKFQETGQQFQETGEELRQLAQSIQETGEQMQETDRRFQETDRKFQETSEQMRQTDKKILEISKQTDRKILEISKQVGSMTNSFGELAEHLVGAGIKEQFNALGFSFTRLTRRVPVLAGDNKTLSEIDILLEGEDGRALAVEIKATLKIRHVDQHVERLELLQAEADKAGKPISYFGAVAGAIINDGVKPYALGQGLYVIEQTGDAVRINAPPDFTPRRWQSGADSAGQGSAGRGWPGGGGP